MRQDIILPSTVVRCLGEMAPRALFSSVHTSVGGYNNKSAQSNLGRGPRRCECLPRGGLITTAKVVAEEFITPHQWRCDVV